MLNAYRSPPAGQITRGKTARNRLRRVDIFALLYAKPLLTRTHPLLFVDLGYGEQPFTLLESAARFRAINPTLPVLGVEIDPQRVASALPYADALTHFRLGGFNLPLRAGEMVGLIRAFNVLRQYEEGEVASAHATLCDYLVPGGLLIEGTSYPYGQIWVANLLRKQAEGWRYEGVVFSTNFRFGFDPTDFQPVLPKNFIHRLTVGEPIGEFFAAWKRAQKAAVAYRAFGVRQWFGQTAQLLAGMGYQIELHPKFLRRGFMVWRFRL
jgi:hypothetical protein